MTPRVALLALGLPFLAFGGEGLYYFAHGRRQETMTCEQFARERPRATWVRLVGCNLDYDAPGYRERDGVIEEIYFPVRPTGAPRTSPAPILAATTDPNALALVQGTIGGGRQPDQEQLTIMMLRVVTLLKAAREVEGRRRAALVEQLATKRALASFDASLQDGYAVIDLHARPEVWPAAIAAATGLVAVLLFLAGRRRARRVAAPATAEVPASAPMEPRLPAMLLLNLDASAGSDAIEHAPPLGTRSEVAPRLVKALGDLHFDERGRAIVQRSNATIELDIGVGEPVWTVTVRAAGPAAADGLRALSAATGWRAYIPRRGTFFDAQ